MAVFGLLTFDSGFLLGLLAFGRKMDCMFVGAPADTLHQAVSSAW